MLDLAHALILDQVEADARARWTVMAAMAAAGASVEEVTPSDAREQLEQWLDEPLTGAKPVDVDEQDWQLRVALGVA